MNTKSYLHKLAVPLAGLLLAVGTPASGASSRFTQPDAAKHPDLFTWTDTCNVHILRDGDASLSDQGSIVADATAWHDSSNLHHSMKFPLSESPWRVGASNQRGNT